MGVVTEGTVNFAELGQFVAGEAQLVQLGSRADPQHGGPKNDPDEKQRVKDAIATIMDAFTNSGTGVAFDNQNQSGAFALYFDFDDADGLLAIAAIQL